MGLDNMPHAYPCRTQGTAIMAKVTLSDGSIDERIGCEETVAAGGCPFTNAKPPPGQVTGFLGTYCWYRGKYGNWLIKALNDEEVDSFDGDDLDNFYGTDEEGLYRPPEACRSLADQMESSLAERGGKLTSFSEPGHDEDELTEQVLFAIWYLRWTADECEGMDAWF